MSLDDLFLLLLFLAGTLLLTAVVGGIVELFMKPRSRWRDWR